MSSPFEFVALHVKDGPYIAGVACAWLYRCHVNGHRSEEALHQIALLHFGRVVAALYHQGD